MEYAVYKLSFKQLSDISINIAKQVSLNKYNRDVNFKLTNLWGMKYKSGELARLHMIT